MTALRLGILSCLLPLAVFGQLVFEPPLQGQINFPDTPVGGVSNLQYRAISRGNGPWNVRLNINNQAFAAIPNQFQVPDGAQVEFTLRFSPQQVGNHRGNLNGTMDNGEIFGRLMATLNGNGVDNRAADMELDPEEIELWAAWDWIETETELIVRNVGQVRLDAELSPGADWLEVDPRQLQVQPGAEAVVTVSVPQWEAMEPAIYETNIRIRSNDPDEGDVLVPALFDRWFFPHYGLPWLALPEESHAFWVERAEIGGEPIDNWDEVGIVTPRGVLAGGGWLEGDEWPFLAFAWGVNEETGFEGFQPGDHFTFFLWDGDADEEFPARAEFLEGPQRYQADALTVINLAAGGNDEQLIALPQGWSLISTHIQMPDPDVTHVLAQVADRLIIFKDEAGRFYYPPQRFNNIPAWNTAQSYQIKMSAADTLRIVGDQIPFDRVLSPHVGWNFIAYYPDRAQRIYDAMIDFRNRANLLTIVKNGIGQFYMPRFDFDRNWQVRPGDGLLMKVTEALQFRYPHPGEGFVPAAAAEELRHFTPPVRTDNNMSIIFTSLSGVDAVEGAELACVSPRGDVAGAMVLTGEIPFGMAVWGDDPTTRDTIENYQEGEELVFVWWDPEHDRELETSFEVVEGSAEYSPNGIAIFGLHVGVEDDRRPLPTVFRLYDAHPNPFNAKTQMRFDLPLAAEVTISILDIQGRGLRAERLGWMQAGRHLHGIAAAELPAGMYLVMVQAGEHKALTKLVLLK